MGPLEKQEEGQFKQHEQRLDLRLRSLSGYGALLLALILYAAGLAAVGWFLGIYPGTKPVAPEMWHIVVAVLVALFSVPTFLVLSVLRSASLMRKDAAADSLHAAVGEKVLALAEKWLENAAK